MLYANARPIVPKSGNSADRPPTPLSIQEMWVDEDTSTIWVAQFVPSVGLSWRKAGQLDYALLNHTHDMSDIVSGVLPIAMGGTDANNASQARANLAAQEQNVRLQDIADISTWNKGDVLVYDGTNLVRLPVGANGLVLKADTTSPTGLTYGTVASPDLSSGGRLTASATDNVGYDDVFNSNTLYFHQYKKTTIPLWDGTNWVERPITDGINPYVSLPQPISLPNDYNKLYRPHDIFAQWNGSSIDLIQHPFDVLNEITITNATNNSPITVTTATAHGFSSNSMVVIHGVTGNTAANGLRRVIVLNATSFLLYTADYNPVAGNGAYVSGGSCFRLSHDAYARNAAHQLGVKDKVVVKSTDHTQRYLGTIFPMAFVNMSHQKTSIDNNFGTNTTIWNNENRIRSTILWKPPTATTTYTTTSRGAWNNHQHLWFMRVCGWDMDIHGKQLNEDMPAVSYFLTAFATASSAHGILAGVSDLSVTSNVISPSAHEPTARAAIPASPLEGGLHISSVRQQEGFAHFFLPFFGRTTGSSVTFWKELVFPNTTSIVFDIEW